MADASLKSPPSEPRSTETNGGACLAATIVVARRRRAGKKRLLISHSPFSSFTLTAFTLTTRAVAHSAPCVMYRNATSVIAWRMTIVETRTNLLNL
jgi:hypothetical protein